MSDPEKPDPEETNADEPSNGDRLDALREVIDGLDSEFVKLLSERMAAVREIADLKRVDIAAPLRDFDRERKLFADWAKAAEARGLSGYFAGRILREILNYSRRDQERLLDRAQIPPADLVRVGFQGVTGSYSDLAITKLFASRHTTRLERTGFRTFEAVVDALESEELDYALLPVENTIAGTINEVYRLLARRAVTVVDEEVWPVEHCLAGVEGAAIEGVRIIRSHPVALQQCEVFLDGCGGAVRESHFDTAAAAQSVAKEGDPSIAAICSEEAAELSGLTIMERDIADQSVNLTRFLLIALKPEPPDPRQPAKTSLIFTVNHRHGALAECLQAFSRHGINLTKLESRPQADAPWEYLFYVDITGATADSEVSAALDEVRTFTNHLKVLGSYPRRMEEGEGVPSIPMAETAPASDDADDEAESPAVQAPSCDVVVDTGYPLCGHSNGVRRSSVRVGRVQVGDGKFVLISGPCAVESRQQILEGAAQVKARGASILRGGAFKPRSSPYSFQGLGFPGLDLLVEAGRAYEMPVVTEVLRIEDAERIAAKADLLQVGARNMQNFALLKKLGGLDRPVLLKRGMSATIDELLAAAEYIMSGGNHRVILCERGIRTFETATRNTLDVSAVPVLRDRTHLPVVVDPSHAAGQRHLVVPLALAAVAAGADGLMVEAHPNPAEALCDKEQALTGEDLDALVSGLESILKSQGRKMA